MILKRTFGVLFILSFLFPPLSFAASSLKEEGLFPAMILCQKGPDALFRVKGKKAGQEYACDGPILDVQAQASGRILVAGGSPKVFLLKPSARGYRKVWEWKALKGFQPASATAADWDLDGLPSLILVADKAKNRIFLAEARTHGVKIRWEYRLPSEPLSARLCPDTGNFLVACADSTVREIFFQKDREVWRVGKEEGLTQVLDAVRSPGGETFVAEASGGRIFCFSRDKKMLWKTSLPDLPGGKTETLFLSLYRVKGKGMLLASGSSGGKNFIDVVDEGSGQVLGGEEALLKRGALLRRAVPAGPAYLERRE